MEIIHFLTDFTLNGPFFQSAMMKVIGQIVISTKTKRKNHGL